MHEFLEQYILDVANDAVAQIAESKNVRSKIERYLRETLNRSDYMEREEACNAYVCAELVAAARGWPDLSIPSLRRTIEKHQDVIADLNLLAAEAIEVLLVGNNELWDTATEADTLSTAAADLLTRLNRGRGPRIQPLKRARFQIGDVFRIELSPNDCAYLRLYEGHCCYIYNGTWALGGDPPIGLRDFLFYTSILPGILGTADCVLVGRDRFGPHESRSSLVYNGPKLLTTVFGTRFPTGVDARPWQCLGMEIARHDDLATIRKRVGAKRSSLEDSLEQFRSFLQPGDEAIAKDALKGRVCRQFDEAENQRFRLIQ